MTNELIDFGQTTGIAWPSSLRQDASASIMIIEIYGNAFESQIVP